VPTQGGFTQKIGGYFRYFFPSDIQLYLTIFFFKCALCGKNAVFEVYPGFFFTFLHSTLKHKFKSVQTYDESCITFSNLRYKNTIKINYYIK